MKRHTHEDPEIQRMRIFLDQGFDDTGVGDGTIKHVVPEDCLYRRNSKCSVISRKESTLKKWIKMLRYR